MATFSVHVFHKNNELAGYSSVLHALQLVGTTGAYGRRLRAAVISFGATARGAVSALFALGVHDVTVLTHRSVPAVASPMAPARLVHYDRDPEQPSRTLTLGAPDPVGRRVARGSRHRRQLRPAGHRRAAHVRHRRRARPLRPGSLFIDVSCDAGMGFEWAGRPRSPSRCSPSAPGVRYYAVDHSPSYLWNSATWEISEALIPFLPAVMAGTEGWDADPTIRRAIEIRTAWCRTRGSSRSRIAPPRTRTRSGGRRPHRRLTRDTTTPSASGRV